jgi:magnesium-transporting ATPase (P-type)
VGTPAREGFLFAVGVTVALVPEGLLPTVTLSLAMGAQRMAGEQALVRHLEAVETLGSTTYVCTDKTGTLTLNQMAVVEVWTPVGSCGIVGTGYEPTGVVDGEPAAIAAAALAMDAARRCSQGRAVERDGGWIAAGDPMEAAIDAAHRRLSPAPAGPMDAPVTEHRPFDPDRRRESVVSDGQLLVKGAPEGVLPRCVHGTAAAAEAVDVLARRGLRILAIARRPADGVPATATADEAESGLELLGLLALQDPPRPGVAESVASCREAGIRVAMLTGDHPSTARAVAAEIGLCSDEAVVLTGADLPDDDEVLGALLDRDGVVLSRVSPEQKLRVARALQRRGHVVAMTGDGVNDAPALRQADIGVAMGRSGTDVAREAADLVLLDDSFSTIVDAVEQGRATYANIRRFLTYHLTDNVAELTPFVLWALSGGRFPLALGVLQILCLDIGTDLLPALALGAEGANPQVLHRPPERRHVIDAPLLRRVFLVLGPAEATFEMLAFLAALTAAGWRPGESFPSGPVLAAASGAAFAAVIVGQVANAFACRSSTRWPGRLGWTTNRLLLVAVGVEVLLLAGFLTVGPVADLLDHAPPPAAAWPVVVAAAPAVLAADALQKRRRAARRQEGRSALSGVAAGGPS